ncbi:hypothetical protein AAG906_039559 [Vitis piasezkii]
MGLPQNCYENDDFLGIAICSVYAPIYECEDTPENYFAHTLENESDDLLEAESSISTELQCQLSLSEGYVSSSLCVRHLSFCSTCKCYHNGEERGTPKALFKGSDNHIWEFKSLKSLFCSHCSQLQYFPEILENMENLRELHLNETAIKELPSSIEHLNRLEVLNLKGCKNLVTLPESICNLCFLQVLNVSYCSKLHKLPQNLGRLQSLKYLIARFLNSTCCQLLSLSIPSGVNQLSMLRLLHLVNLIISGSCGIPKWISHHKNGATVVAELPQNWCKNNDLLGFVLYCVYDPLDNESEETLENDATYFQYGLTFRGHQIQFVDELRFYPTFHCYDVLKSLTTLDCSGCSRLRSFPEILEDVENLRKLHLDGTAIEELPASIQYLRGLQCLNLADCTNLVSLNLSMDCFSSILAGIIQLSKLRVVELSHCQGPLQVPELTPSLRVLDVHSCTCLETLSSPSSLLGVSLFKCFKSTIEFIRCSTLKLAWKKPISVYVLILLTFGFPHFLSHLILSLTFMFIDYPSSKRDIK